MLMTTTFMDFDCRRRGGPSPVAFLDPAYPPPSECEGGTYDPMQDSSFPPAAHIPSGAGPTNGPAAARRSAQMSVNHERIRAAVREILLAVGEDPDREGLRETPERVARMYAEMFAGLHKD